jgi:heat shock protein HslJ
VTLGGGVWRDGPPGDANASSVELLRAVRVTGDITGNGNAEAVVLLESRRPPAASRVYLAVVGWVGGQLVNIATTPLSEDVQITGGHIEPRRIILDGVRRAAAGATPAPVKLTYDLSGTRLRLISAEASAPASAVLPPPPTLAGTSWRLVQFQSMDDTTLKPDAGASYTLSFEEGGVLLVQADCNRGRGQWRSTNNVSIELGALAMTRASCASRMYDRFVRDLGDVRSYVLKDGQLYLSLKIDSGIYQFAPTERPPAP